MFFPDANQPKATRCLGSGLRLCCRLGSGRPRGARRFHCEVALVCDAHGVNAEESEPNLSSLSVVHSEWVLSFEATTYHGSSAAVSSVVNCVLAGGREAVGRGGDPGNFEAVSKRIMTEANLSTEMKWRKT